MITIYSLSQHFVDETWPKLIPADSISKETIDKKFQMVIFYPPYFKLLPWQHQLRYEFENYL